MATGSWSHEVTTTVPAGRLYKAALLDWHKLGPQLVPEIIASASVTSADGTVGSIRVLKFTSAMPFGYVKERLEFIDESKFEVKTSLIEGGKLGTLIESGTSHFKIEPLSNGGSIAKVKATYKLMAGVEDSADDIAKAKDGITKHMKAVEAFLIKNPTAYA